MPEWVELLLAAIGSVGVWKVIEAMVNNRARKKVTDAEASSIIAEASNKTLEGAFRLIKQIQESHAQLSERVDRQEKEITWLQRALGIYAERVAYLMSGIAVLLQQISKTSDQPPCWNPDEWQPPDKDNND